MQIIDFLEATELKVKSESEKAKLLCYYHFKETGEAAFSMALISELMVNSGFNAPNTSRLKDKLTKSKDKSFIKTKGKTTTIEFVPAVLQSLEKNIGGLWLDSTTIESDSELLDETKFCGYRGYLDRLIQQINHSYTNNCYDATAVLLRRLFEVLLVLSYQNLGIDSEIRDTSGNGYIMLEGIVRNAKANRTLNLSRIKNEFDTFRMVGNFSAHNITYTAGKKDIDDIKLSYLDMHSGLIQRKSAKKLGTSKGYFSDLIERFWNQQVESPISELNCRVRNFCRGEAECIWLSPEDINTVKLYIKGAAARSGIAYDEMQRNSVYGQFLPEQFMHDYLSEFAMRSTNVLDELLSVLSVTILLNRTERRFVVPRNCFYQVLIADFFIWVAPISPQCALLLYPEDRYHIADDSYFTIDSPLEVDRMNLCALKYEHTFNCDFIAASRRDELEFLQHCLQAIETAQSGTGEQYLTD